MLNMHDADRRTYLIRIRAFGGEMWCEQADDIDDDEGYGRDYISRVKSILHGGAGRQSF